MFIDKQNVAPSFSFVNNFLSFFDKYFSNYIIYACKKLPALGMRLTGSQYIHFITIFCLILVLFHITLSQPKILEKSRIATKVVPFLAKQSGDFNISSFTDIFKVDCAFTRKPNRSTKRNRMLPHFFINPPHF